MPGSTKAPANAVKPIDFSLGETYSGTVNLRSREGIVFIVNTAHLKVLSTVFRSMLDDAKDEGKPIVLTESAVVLGLLFRTAFSLELPPIYSTTLAAAMNAADKYNMPLTQIGLEAHLYKLNAAGIKQVKDSISVQSNAVNLAGWYAHWRDLAGPAQTAPIEAGEKAIIGGLGAKVNAQQTQVLAKIAAIAQLHRPKDCLYCGEAEPHSFLADLKAAPLAASKVWIQMVSDLQRDDCAVVFVSPRERFKRITRRHMASIGCKTCAAHFEGMLNVVEAIVGERGLGAELDKKAW